MAVADYLTGGSAAPSRYGFGALASYMGQYGPSSYGGQAKSMLGEATKAGLFDPTNKRLRDLVKRRALLSYGSGQRATGAESTLYGLNPAQSRAAMVNQDIAGRGQLADSLLGADLSGLQSGQNFYRNLFTGGLDYERQRQLAREQQKAQSQGGIGGAIGSIGGALVSHFL